MIVVGRECKAIDIMLIIYMTYVLFRVSVD